MEISHVNGAPVLPSASGPPTEAPFDQQVHDQLLRAIDRVADEWIEQLKAIRANSEKIEALVLQRVTDVKAQITGLFLLGKAAEIEAKHGDDINTKLATELLKLAPEGQQQ